MKAVLHEVLAAIQEGPGIYFAPSSVRLKIKQNQLVIWWQRNASGGVWLQGA